MYSSVTIEKWLCLQGSLIGRSSEESFVYLCRSSMALCFDLLEFDHSLF